MFGGFMSNDICQINYVDEKRVAQAQKVMPSDEALRQLTETFKVLGDLTRLRILHALSVTELCVCDLSTLLEASSSAISHQLRLLRAANLVKYRKKGKMVYYSLDDDHIPTLIAEGLGHIQKI